MASLRKYQRFSANYPDFLLDAILPDNQAAIIKGMPKSKEECSSVSNCYVTAYRNSYWPCRVCSMSTSELCGVQKRVHSRHYSNVSLHLAFTLNKKTLRTPCTHSFSLQDAYPYEHGTFKVSCTSILAFLTCHLFARLERCRKAREQSCTLEQSLKKRPDCKCDNAPKNHPSASFLARSQLWSTQKKPVHTPIVTLCPNHNCDHSTKTSNTS